MIFMCASKGESSVPPMIGISRRASPIRGDAEVLKESVKGVAEGVAKDVAEGGVKGASATTTPATETIGHPPTY